MAIPVYEGWYAPHEPVNWSSEITDPETGEVKENPLAVSMTKQSHKEECDINNIIKAFSVTGMVNHINEKAAQGVYTDLPEPTDYQESLNLVIAAEASFASLPSLVRDRFGNDPEQFLAFMADPANQDEMVKLGLATERPQEPVTASPPPAAPPPPELPK